MTFDIKKFFSGFAFWKGDKLGKLLFYGVIAVFVATIALGLYHKIVGPTYSTDNKNTIDHPGNVTIDQRVITRTSEQFIGVKLWFLKLGVSWDIPSQQEDK